MALTITINLDDEEQKALEWDIDDVQAWAAELVTQRLVQNAKLICRLALEDETHTILSQADKELLITYLSNQGVILTTVDKLPANIIKEIVKRSTLT